MAVAVVSMFDNSSLWDLGKEQGVTRMRYETHPEFVKEVCLECLQYHDVVFDIDDPEAPDVPIHPQCACLYVPEFDAGSVLGQDPDGEPIIANPPPEREVGEYLAEKLKAMTVEQMDSYIGPGRGKLLRSGQIEPSQLADSHGVTRVQDLLDEAEIDRGEYTARTYGRMAEESRQRISAWNRRASRKNANLRQRNRAAQAKRERPYTVVGPDSPGQFGTRIVRGRGERR